MSQLEEAVLGHMLISEDVTSHLDGVALGGYMECDEVEVGVQKDTYDGDMRGMEVSIQEKGAMRNQDEAHMDMDVAEGAFLGAVVACKDFAA